PATTASYTLSLHDALPISGEEKPSKSRTGLHGYGLKSIRQIVEQHGGEMNAGARGECFCVRLLFFSEEEKKLQTENEHVTDKSLDRKSTRLNSSHVSISYA